MAFVEVKKIGQWANPFHSTSKAWFGSLDIAPSTTIPDNNLLTINFSPSTYSTKIGHWANVGTWRKINGHKVIIRNDGTWCNIKTTKPRFTGRVKWINPTTYNYMTN